MCSLKSKLLPPSAEVLHARPEEVQEPREGVPQSGAEEVVQGETGAGSVEEGSVEEGSVEEAGPEASDEDGRAKEGCACENGKGPVDAASGGAGVVVSRDDPAPAALLG
jgi:hypothetical protein